MAEFGALYTLTTPYGVLTFNPTGGDRYILSDVAGLDMAAIRGGSEPLPQRDGVAVADGYFGARQVALSGQIVPADGSFTTRKTMMDTLAGRLASIVRSDGTLRWYPSGSGTVGSLSNLMLNGVFESDITGWDSSALGGTLTSDATHAKYGGRAGKLVVGAANQGVTTTTPEAYFTNGTYTYGFWAYAEVAAVLEASFWRSDYGDQKGTAVYRIAPGNWIYCQNTIVLPASNYMLGFRLVSPLTPDAVWLDGVQVGRTAPELWDNFERADTSPGTIGTANSGQAWSLTGGGYTAAKISSGKFVLPGNPGSVYAYKALSGPVVRATGRFLWTAGGASADHTAGILCGPDHLLNTMLHPFVTRTAWTVQVRQAGGAFVGVATGSYSSLALDTLYDWGWMLNGDTLTVYDPAGGTHTVTDSRFSQVIGPTIIYEISAGETYPADALRWDAVEAETSLLVGDATPRFMTVRLQDMLTVKGGVLKDFNFSLVAGDPRIYTDSLTTVNSGPLASGTVDVSVTNDGNARAYPILRIYGGVTNPVVTNVTTGKAFSLAYVVAPGAYVEINTAPGQETVKLNGSTSLADKLTITSTTELWPIEPGANTLRLAGTSPNGSEKLQAAFRPTWA